MHPHQEQPTNSVIIQRQAGNVVVSVSVVEYVKAGDDSVMDWAEVQRVTSEYVEQLLAEESDESTTD